MLILTRKLDESVLIGDEVKVQVVSLRGNNCQLGIVAPADVKVLREELVGRSRSKIQRDGDVQYRENDLQPRGQVEFLVRVQEQAVGRREKVLCEEAERDAEDQCRDEIERKVGGSGPPDDEDHGDDVARENVADPAKELFGIEKDQSDGPVIFGCQRFEVRRLNDRADAEIKQSDDAEERGDRHHEPVDLGAVCGKDRPREDKPADDVYRLRKHRQD